MSNYPTFRRTSAPPPRLVVERPKQRSPELGTKWGKAARTYLDRNPFCAECRRRGRDVIAQVVDHIVPRHLGGAMWDRVNWQSLCHLDHNGTKRDLERLAVEHGDVHLLVNWMRDPSTRPGRYAYIACDEGADDGGAREDR